MDKKKPNARYDSGRVSDSQARSDAVVRHKPRPDGKGTYSETVTEFPVGPGSARKAADYASELQRETRGYAKGGVVRGYGAARKPASGCKGA